MACLNFWYRFLDFILSLESMHREGRTKCYTRPSSCSCWLIVRSVVVPRESMKDLITSPGLVVIVSEKAGSFTVLSIDVDWQQNTKKRFRDRSTPFMRMSLLFLMFDDFYWVDVDVTSLSILSRPSSTVDFEFRSGEMLARPLGKVKLFTLWGVKGTVRLWVSSNGDLSSSSTYSRGWGFKTSLSGFSRWAS